MTKEKTTQTENYSQYRTLQQLLIDNVFTYHARNLDYKDKRRNLFLACISRTISREVKDSKREQQKQMT